MAGLKLVTPPTVEPITVAFAKEYLRQDGEAEDDVIAFFVSAAREFAEKHTNRGFITQSFVEYFDTFPGYGLPGGFNPQYGLDGWLRPAHFHHFHDRFELSRSPLQAVASIQYKDATGATQTVDPATWYVNDKQDPASIHLVPGKCWPCPLWVVNSVWVDYTVGYSDDAGKVPKTLMQAMLLGMSHWYANRDLYQSNQLMEMPYGMKNLLDKDRVYYQP